MLGAEKSELLNALRAGREVLGHALANVDEGLAQRTPDSAGWSILQCMEHMVESERYLLSRLRRATAAEHQQENRAREAKIAAIAADRTHHIQAPEMVRPAGRFSTLSEALAAFDVTRAEVVAWALRRICSSFIAALIRIYVRHHLSGLQESLKVYV
jgi:hypothetical protein